ncbi:MAG: hypothetical protein LBU23_05720 [Planctomycetota bacterium]|jgi:hypothetical protein|nr:hypothetical protein [Planctomycetota bacterium]
MPSNPTLTFPPSVIVFQPIRKARRNYPAHRIRIRLVAGWILCPARRAITGMYPFADPKRENRVDVHHYFFRAASWPQCELFAGWARFLVGRL